MRPAVELITKRQGPAELLAAAIDGLRERQEELRRGTLYSPVDGARLRELSLTISRLELLLAVLREVASG